MAGRYPKQNWLSNFITAPYGPLGGARLQHLEDWLAQIFDDHDAHVAAVDPHPGTYVKASASPPTNGVVYYNGSAYVTGLINQNNLASGTQIPKAMLGPLGIVDADVVSIPAAKVTGLSSAIPAGIGPLPWPTLVAPAGWAIADGTAKRRAGVDPDGKDYSAYFGVVGVQFGAGDGTTTFNLPDGRGRIPVFVGTHADVATIGNSDGAAVGSRRPRHKHTVGNPAINISDPGHAHTGGVAAPGFGSGNGNGGLDSATNTGVSGTGISASASGGTVGPQTGAEPTDSAAYIVMQGIIKL